jgi:mannose-6-phosphate isomerase-like protein (cupin superfamily)
MSTATRTDAVWFIDTLAHVRISGSDSEGRFGLVELSGRRGHMPPLHVHHSEDEAFVVLEGELTIYVGKEMLVLGANDAAFAPRDVPHTFRIESETARWLAAATPAGFDRFVETVGSPALEPTLPDEPVMPDPERFAAICEEFGIELLGPPGTLP